MTPLLLLAARQSPPEIAILPQPVSVVRAVGSFVFSDYTIVADDACHRLTWLLPPFLPGPHTANVVRLAVDPAVNKPEGYRLRVTPTEVEVRGHDPAGVFYGLQTLRQLLPAGSLGPRTEIACVTIEDCPRFPWRGMMLDCSRHFFPKAFIEKFIDLLAMQKMNTFHWHLTDDQGWRMQIRRHPKLTSVGGYRKETIIGGPHDDPKQDIYDHTPYGGFYTQDDVREVVRYAAKRFVRVIPEIEMPGHSAAALAAYPELATHPPVEVWTSWGVNLNTINLEESTFRFYEGGLDEIFRLFPSAFIHLGGDEAPTDQWGASDRIKERMRELGIGAIDQVQPYITARMAAFVASKGRRMVSWDEVLNGKLPPNVVVMSWRGTSGGEKAAAAGHDVVMAPSPYVYFGPRLQIDKVYGYDPCPSSFSSDQAKHVLGAQGEIWCEHELAPENVSYAAFPNSCALAEVDWTPQAERNYGDFLTRLGVYDARLRALGVKIHEP